MPMPEFLWPERLDAMRQMVPQYLHKSIIRYIELGEPPAYDVLTAIINGNLKKVLHALDAMNTAEPYKILEWFHEYAPAGCWGSPTALNDWPEFLKHRNGESHK